MRRFLVLLVAALFLGVAAKAQAQTLVLEDRQGRPISFDVLAPAVGVEWYANLLRAAPHGDEIRGVTVRIVPAAELPAACGADAGGCYRGGRGRGLIVVPAGRTAWVAHALVHEYGHHLDHSRAVGGLPEPNGTPGWWEARGLKSLLDAREVAFDYSLGWTRSVGEIFAEDYTQLSLQTSYRIGWLSPPAESVLAALRSDLGAAATPPSTPPADPVVVVRRGTLTPGKSRALPFGLLGPGRRVTFTAQVGGARARGTRARVELVCGSRRTVKTLRRGQSSTTIDARGLGPDSCRVALVSTSRTPLSYVVRLRLAVEP